MATWTNANKSTAAQSLTWDQDTNSWDGSGADTWDTQYAAPAYTNQSKSTSVFTNQIQS